MAPAMKWGATWIAIPAIVTVALAAAAPAVAQELVVQRQRYSTQPPDPPHSASGFVGSAFFHGWFRYPGDKRKPVTFDDVFFFLGEPLLADASGAETTALVSDWRYNYKATYRCNGLPQVWDLEFFRPDGSLFLHIRDEYNSNCDFRGFTNGVLTDFIPGTPFVLEFFGPALACDPQQAGVWTFTMDFNATPVDLATIGMTDHPQVRRGAEVRLVTGASNLQVDIPAVAGFSAAVPGESTQVFLSVLDPICGTSVPNVPVTATFLFEAGSGGHAHQTVDRVAVPDATAQQMALSGVAPARGSGSFNPATGTWTATSLASGALQATVTAGQVSGSVRIDATASDVILVPSVPKRLAVREPGLSPLPESFNYALVGDLPPHPHPDSHDVSDLHRVADRIEDLAHRFALRSIFEPSHLQYLLRINDASLPMGGLFDLADAGAPRWQPPHQSHRDGRHQDISFFVIDVGTGQPVARPNTVLRWVTAILGDNDPFAEVIREGDHLHVRF